MFCRNCGAQIADDATKCEKCGFEVVQEVQEKKTTELKLKVDVDVKELVQKNKKAVTIGAAVAAVLLLVIVFALTKKTTVNLNDYVTVTFSGYDTVGRAYYEFDEKAFLEDFSDKIKMKKKKGNADAEEMYAILSEVSGAELMMYNCVAGSLDKTSDLSNGDTVKIEWNCEDEIAKENFNVKLKYKEKEYKVEGLEQAKIVDPFEGIEVAFTGVAPAGQANIQNNSSEEVLRSVHYEATPNTGLKNGDKVVVKANATGNEDYYLSNYGVIIDQGEKEFVVEGLCSYAQSASEISEDMLEKMKKQAEDTLRAQSVNWNANITLQNVQYIGNYFLKPKFASGFSNYNTLHLMYRVDTVFEKDTFVEPFSFYYYTTYNNIMIMDDGSTSVDLSNYSTASTWSGINHEFQYSDSWWSDTTSQAFPGYESLDIAFNKLVTAVVDQYEYENNITE